MTLVGPYPTSGLHRQWDNRLTISAQLERVTTRDNNRWLYCIVITYTDRTIELQLLYTPYHFRFKTASETTSYDLQDPVSLERSLSFIEAFTDEYLNEFPTEGVNCKTHIISET